MYRNQSYQTTSQQQGQELILQPQKLAFDSESNLEKQYNSFEYTTHQQNKLRDLLNYRFTFEPNFFEIPNRINYKPHKIEMFAEEFLPSVKMDTKVIRKIQQLLKDGLNKQFYLAGSSFESSSHDLVHQTFYLDKVSFDFEDSFEKSFYGRHEYSLACFCIGDTSRTMRPSKIMHEQLKEAIKGISSFQGIDFSDVQEYQYRKTDLLYLNHFRIYLFFEGSQTQKDQYKIHRYLYYPRINFSAQLISQPFRLVSTPIAAFLTQKIKNSDMTQKEIAKRKNLVKFGFLSLDRNSRMIPLHASDDYCVQIPLVGVWTYGIEFTEDETCEHSAKRFVWSLLTEFVKNKTIAQRFSYNQQQKSFVLAVFNLDRSAKYYEICIQENMDDEEDYEVISQVNEQNLNNSNCQTLSRKWCMIKNYSNSADQSQPISMSYSSHSDIASKLSLEYPFRYCQKMVVNYFDDDEFFKSIKLHQMKQYQVVQQQQQQNEQTQQVSQQMNLSNISNNNKQTVKRNTNNSNVNINSNQNNINNNKTKQPSQQFVNNKNNEQEDTSSQNDLSGNNNSAQQTKLLAMKNQMLELQNKQDDFFQESQKSIQSASFANNQTFAQNLQHMQPNPENNANTNTNNNNNNNNNSNSNNNNAEAGLQLPPAAERIIQQQQEQINKMSQQIQQLTEALKSFQNNTSRQITDNQSQYSYPLSPQSQSQIIQNPPSLSHSRNPMYKNYPPHPMLPPYYYDQYHYYPPHHPMGPAHQYPPPPYPPFPADHPYNMYHRAPYYMHESIISGDGKSSRGGMNNMMNNNGNLNNFGVDAISDIQSIKKEDDTQSEASQQFVLNNFHAQLKVATNMVQQPSDEQLSFAHNNNNMFTNNLTSRAMDQQQNNGNNFNNNSGNNLNPQHATNQSNQFHQVNQSTSSGTQAPPQLAQQNSFQSINNQSMQEQQGSMNNGIKKHIRDDSLTTQIQKQNAQFANENTFQYKENMENNISVRGGRKSEIQFDNQNHQQNESQLQSEKPSFESSSDPYSKYSPHMYYGEEHGKNSKSMIQEKVISERPSVNQSPSSFNYKSSNNLDKLQQHSIQIGSHYDQYAGHGNQYGHKDNTDAIELNKANLIEENKKQIKKAMDNIALGNIDSEETFTIDAKCNFKMNLDFLNSERKPDDTNSSSNLGKENKNDMNKIQTSSYSQQHNNNVNNKDTKSSNTPASNSSSALQSSFKSKIPKIQYNFDKGNDSDDSDDDEIKEIEKKYRSYVI